MSLWRHLESDIREDNCGRGCEDVKAMFIVYSFFSYLFTFIYSFIRFFISLFFNDIDTDQWSFFSYLNLTVRGICCFDYLFIFHYNSNFHLCCRVYYYSFAVVPAAAVVLMYMAMLMMMTM